jgi:hypothetical protein
MKSGCICYLVSAEPIDVADLGRSLSRLYANYIRAFPCDIYIFHEADLAESVRIDIQRSAPMPVVFCEIQFPAVTPPVDIDASPYRMGYRHMCHFFANDIFHRPELKDYAYYMRLDTDSMILSPLSFDLFDYMQASDGLYGFVSDDFLDRPEYAKGLWPLAERFVGATQYPIFKKMYQDIPERKCFYTNFEICRLDWFRKAPWTDFFAEIDRAGGIYTTRWGDHIIRYLGVNLFAPPGRIVNVPVHYYHQGEYGQAHATRKLAASQVRLARALCMAKLALSRRLKEWLRWRRPA